LDTIPCRLFFLVVITALVWYRFEFIKTLSTEELIAYFLQFHEMQCSISACKKAVPMLTNASRAMAPESVSLARGTQANI
jgi:hypothetical protein